MDFFDFLKKDPFVKIGTLEYIPKIRTYMYFDMRGSFITYKNASKRGKGCLVKIVKVEEKST